MCSKVEDKTTKTGCRSKACFVYLYVCGFFWFFKKKSIKSDFPVIQIDNFAMKY